MLYKLTETTLRNGRVVINVESTDTPHDGFIQIAPHIIENARYKTIAQVTQEQHEWEAEQQRLAMEKSATIEPIESGEI